MDEKTNKIETSQDAVPLPPNFEERSKAFEFEFGELLKKYEIKIDIKPTFNRYRIIPDEVQLALLVLIRNDVEYKMVYTDLQKGKTI